MQIAAQARMADVLQPMEAAAFAAFVEARRERAVRVAYRMLAGDQDAAEDVAQNAFLRAHRSPAFAASRASPGSTGSRARGSATGAGAGAAAFTGAAEQVRGPRRRGDGDPGLRRRIIRALERLSPAQREVFVLVHLEEQSVAETAAVLGKAIGTVKSHVHRALESLRHDHADLSREGRER
jgi:DNA-directed RNA polymerase specialized sigma24 family protein